MFGHVGVSPWVLACLGIAWLATHGVSMAGWGVLRIAFRYRVCTAYGVRVVGSKDFGPVSFEVLTSRSPRGSFPLGLRGAACLAATAWGGPAAQQFF